MSTIQRAWFRAATEEYGVDLERVEADPRLREIASALRGLDNNGDGLLATDREIDEVYDLLNRMDGEPGREIRTRRAVDGSETPAAALIDALGEAARMNRMRARLECPPGLRVPERG